MNKISMSQTCLCSIFYQKATNFFPTTSRYRGHSAIVQHNSNLATVHSWVTVGGCSVEYNYKLVCQFTATVGGTRCYLWLNRARATHCRATQSILLISWSRTERQWLKGYWILRYQLTSQTNYGYVTEKKKFFFVWPCNNVIQIDKMLVYGLLCTTVWANWCRSSYSYSIKQLLNYSGMPSVATGCCENPVALMFYRQVCDKLISFMNMYL